MIQSTCLIIHCIDKIMYIAGFVLQQHLSSLKTSLFHTEASLRLATLGLLGTMLRQGIVTVISSIYQSILTAFVYNRIVCMSV